MKKIPLTQGKFATVDNEQYGRVAQHKWCVSIKNSHGKPYFYAVRNIYITGNGRPTMVYMHRLLCDAPNNKALVIDHINGNTLDNRKVNLRVVDRATNLANVMVTV